MKKIGITLGVEYLENKNKFILNEEYFKSIAHFGVCVIPLIPTDNIESVKTIIEFLDGIIISGGSDINSLYYNENQIEELGKYYNQRDSFELALCKEATRYKKPVLGICRGLQIINIGFGGTLYQDILKQTTSKIRHYNDDYDNCEHFINIVENSFLYDASQTNRMVVNSIHHQAIKKLGENLTVIASADDGIIEAIENKEQNIYGVQFHPERDLENEFYKKIFKNFIDLL